LNKGSKTLNFKGFEIFWQTKNMSNPLIFLDKQAEFRFCYPLTEGQGISIGRDYKASEGAEEKGVKTGTR